MAGEEKTPKILLVEDDVFMVDLLAREFKGAGFEVLVAKTGSEGVEKFREAKPDLILLDIMLPGLNGFDALRQIRREEKGPTTKVIVLSNLGDVSDKEEAKRLGVIDYMIKANSSIAEIIEKVRSVLAAS